MDKKLAEKLLNLNYKLYEEEAESFSKSRNILWEKEIIKFTQDIKPHSSVLDLGCGNARLYQILSQKEINYLGIDPSKKLIQLDKNKYCYSNISGSQPNCHSDSLKNIIKEESHPKFEVGDGLTLNYKNQFDYVLSIAVIHHIPGKDLQLKFLKNIYNALKPQGKALITAWNRHQDKYIHFMDSPKIYPGMDKTDTLVPWKQSGNYRFIHCFTPEELIKLSQVAGFHNIICYYINKNGKSDQNDGLNIYLELSK